MQIRDADDGVLVQGKNLVVQRQARGLALLHQQRGAAQDVNQLADFPRRVRRHPLGIDRLALPQRGEQPPELLQTAQPLPEHETDHQQTSEQGEGAQAQRQLRDRPKRVGDVRTVELQAQLAVAFAANFQRAHDRGYAPFDPVLQPQWWLRAHGLLCLGLQPSAAVVGEGGGANHRAEDGFVQRFLDGVVVADDGAFAQRLQRDLGRAQGVGTHGNHPLLELVIEKQA